MKNKTIKTMLLVLTVSFTGTSYVAAHAQQASEDALMGMGTGNMGTGHMSTEHMGTGQMGMGQMGMGGIGMGNMPMNFSQLNLTDQQKQEIQAITAASNNGNHQNMGNMQVHHAEMQALLSDAVFDENKAKTIMAEHHSQMDERMLEMLKTQHQIFQLLDDQQKEQAMGMQNNRMNAK
ncbi:MAG: protein CpxP [Psychromonas sp.]|jgi:protein CpxP|uniref:Spy/CpxP family protein refolding chaperone n=1 Tax=Psychromonas sp. TaxID=1884585 RepID=UPI0039E5DE12